MVEGTGLIDCKWTDILLELNVDRVIYFIFLLNKGYIHYYCGIPDVQHRLDNLLLLLAYFLDPGLQSTGDGRLPCLPETVIHALEPLEKPLSPENRLLDIRGNYDDYIYQFYKNDIILDIKRIGGISVKAISTVKL